MEFKTKRSGIKGNLKVGILLGILGISIFVGGSNSYASKIPEEYKSNAQFDRIEQGYTRMFKPQWTLGNKHISYYVNNDSFKKYWIKGFENWNKASNVSLYQTKDIHTAQIVASSGDCQGNLGLAHMSFDPWHTEHIQYEYITADTNLLKPYDKRTKLSVAEHEEGHALGLEDEWTGNKKSLMYEYDTNLISKKDSDTVNYIVEDYPEEQTTPAYHLTVNCENR